MPMTGAERSRNYYHRNRTSILEKLSVKRHATEDLYYRSNRKKVLEFQRSRHKRLKLEPLYLFKRSRRSAIDRGIKFSLSFDEFMIFWGKPCSYCGDEIKTAGLDRVDSSVGYFLGNICPSCTDCNRAKLKMSRENFIALCKRVAKLHG